MASNDSRLSIFVHRASECLTDHEPHGEGLIAFSLLNGLAERGHTVFAYADHVRIRRCSPNLHTRAQAHRVPANSLAPWEHGWRADRWLAQLVRQERVDVVWRMNPFGIGCPRPPHALGRPLVIGPIYYPWPADQRMAGARPRFGIGLGGMIGPLARRGWRRTLSAASLIFCATTPHARQMESDVPGSRAVGLPVIVNCPPQYAHPRETRRPAQPIRLAFVGNLLPNKNPLVFCQAITALLARGVQVSGVLVGDGSERHSLRQYCDQAGLAPHVTFLGKVPNAEVFGHVREADLLVSTSCGEPYGRNIAEAMSVGTPCVCHRSGGPADIITSGVDGLLVDQLTPEAYAEAIAPLWSDPTAWARLSEAARARAREWEEDVVLNRLEEQLREVVAKSCHPRATERVD